MGWLPTRSPTGAHLQVKILKVFDDNTDLELSVGDFTSVSTSPNGALCGYSMEPGSKQLLFVSTVRPPEHALPWFAQYSLCRRYLAAFATVQKPETRICWSISLWNDFWFSDDTPLRAVFFS